MCASAISAPAVARSVTVGTVFATNASACLPPGKFPESRAWKHFPTEVLGRPPQSCAQDAFSSAPRPPTASHPALVIVSGLKTSQSPWIPVVSNAACGQFRCQSADWGELSRATCSPAQVANSAAPAPMWGGRFFYRSATP